MDLNKVADVKRIWIEENQRYLILHEKMLADEKNKLTFYKNELDLWQLEKALTDKRKFENKVQGLERLIERCNRMIEYYKAEIKTDRIKLYILRGDPK